MTYEATKQAIIDMGIGDYGQKWMHFMEEHHPKKVRQMQKNGKYFDVAKSVDDSAWEYRELLDNQYAECHPRPSSFEAVVSWETTRSFYTNGTVMRERVLVIRSEP